MNTITQTAVRGLSGALVLLLALPVWAQTSSGDIFNEADSLMQAAVEADVPLLSPDNYDEAQKYYTKAKGYADKGRADKAQKELPKTIAALNAGLEVSKLAKVNFKTAIEQRNLALEAEAPKYEAELWEAAEKQFNSAARELEDGDVNNATEEGDKAVTAYGEAELAAIQTAIVGEARTLIAKADDDKVDREAPLSLNKAKEAVVQAEAALADNRYDTIGPIALAALAEYEAEHAMYIASQVRMVDDDELTVEAVILDWEKPLQSIATVVDVTSDMRVGYEKSATASLTKAELLMLENAEMAVAIAELEAQVGGSELIVEEAQRMQDELAAVEALFTPEQARIVREQGDLVLRLVGLSFETGKSGIETKYFSLLTNVQAAIDIFPEAPIVIEGHTDSQGSDAVNSKLSQDRANAVREYLLANLALPESRVSAVGLGESDPIATNDTPEGRAQNRRIDVVIKGVRSRAGM